jgi:hypothetical protein
MNNPYRFAFLLPHPARSAWSAHGSRLTPSRPVRPRPAAAALPTAASARMVALRSIAIAGTASTVPCPSPAGQRTLRGTRAEAGAALLRE